MSVIGLTFSFTHLLMRTRSVQALLLRTTSRGALVVALHSIGWSTQNSTQPIGGRVDAPIETNIRSCAALPEAAPAASVKAQPTASILLYLEVISSPLRRVGTTIARDLLVCR
jgi:hypothetical protein